MNPSSSSNLQNKTSQDSNVQLRESLLLRNKIKILINILHDNQAKLKNIVFDEIKQLNISFCENEKDATIIKESVLKETVCRKPSQEEEEEIIYVNKNEHQKKRLHREEEKMTVKDESFDVPTNKTKDKKHYLELEHKPHKLEQHLQEVKSENEELKLDRARMIKVNKEIECLKLELEDRETAVQNQHDQIQIMRAEMTRKENKEFSEDRQEKLRQHLVESREKEFTLEKSISELVSKDKEKNNEISKLKQQLCDKESELDNAYIALKIQKSHAETEQEDFKYETERLHKTLFQKEKCIESLKSQLKENEAETEKYHVQHQNVLIQNKENESNLKGVIQDLQCEIMRINAELKDKVKELKQDEELKKTLRQSLKEKAELSEAISNLEIKVKNKSEQISVLKHQLTNIHQRESDLRDTSLSLQMQLKYAETELEKNKRERRNEKEDSRYVKEQLTEKIKEIERLKLEVQKHKTKGIGMHDQLLDAIRLKEETEEELNGIIKTKTNKIEHIMGEIEKKDTIIDEAGQVHKRNEQLQRELLSSHKRETELIASVNKLKTRNQDNEIQVTGLKLQLKEMHQRFSELENTRFSLQRKLTVTEKELKQCKQKMDSSKTAQVEMNEKKKDNEHKEELEISVAEMAKVIECLKQEVKEKEIIQQDFLIKYQNEMEEKVKSESKLNEVINIQRGQIQHLQGELDKICIKISEDSALEETGNELIKGNEEKEIQIFELKDQLSKIQGTLLQKEIEWQNMRVLLQKEVQNTKISKDESRQEMELSNRVQEQMKGEIENLKLEVNRLNQMSGVAREKEAEFENMNLLLIDSKKQGEKTESELNAKISKQKKDIQHLQEEINRKNIELSTKEELRLKYLQVKQDLEKIQENKAALIETTEVLQNRTRVQENRISELTHQKDKVNEMSNQRESDLKDANHSLQEKIEIMESELEYHKQEISNEKQLSQSLQVKIDSLVREKELKEREMKYTKDNLSGNINSQIEKTKQLEKEDQQQNKKDNKENKEAVKELEAMETKMTDLKDQLNRALGQLHDTQTELDETKSRLSRVMGDRLTDNNPNITDLSDRNRPTKIAEKCAELYDNQWTDAFDVLETHFDSEEAVIEVLLHILQDIMSFCQTMARRQMDLVKRDIMFASTQDRFDMPSDMQRLLKDLRKAMANDVVANIKKVYVSQLEQSNDKELKTALEVDEYTSECIEICWFMVIQDPPVVFGPLPEEGSSFDTDFYKTYTRSGTLVEYSVWPSLLLHEGGPILSKGVAQGYGKR